ncbi:bifunctional 4-hydroxy-2-oxoglutarate aldolase/2-dehydro-3-deoxy-phosphogluconate aldolase [Mycolicibacterium komossense]|uniref:2-dehydro-3-deoxy-phosphogluconate aldolase n=1 Tax=Mycolicibacterium komossense TaxID=1779 RepID=A0ABT3CBD5_9MYCO|nr:bifunctional 4-hydroxy-2-oxoglutarate aldolase/2-dehydro-3-deoxy-phosphogluconate aldolase [Mycolicibacterium komossense]MCV7226721.1 bifunctional 4-hydroxy-2-oxoglutarate aldolase/2-dehydro-3-deoxy-phosphogluconate aldolase [Mycolicibacterium komossense]
MAGILTDLSHLRVVPVVQLDDSAAAPRLGEALQHGGLPVVEVTFRTAAAAAAIRQLRRHCRDVLVGAGTVLTPTMVDVAIEAGAAFVVTPGFNQAVVDHCRRRQIPIIPGVNSPTGVEQGLANGLALLKFFPAVASGGLAMLKALGGPYGEVSFMPTGGITADTAPGWLAQPNVAAIGGTWIAPAADISAGDFSVIAERAAQAAAIGSTVTIS